MVIAVFTLSRILLLLASFIAQKTVPYLGFFPYKELLVEYKLPTLISQLANFDGIHYLLIAKQGYSQWEQAFFPLFPLLIRAFSFLMPNYLISALLISNISFLIGLIFFKKLLEEWKMKNITPLFFLLAFPTAFFFGVVYTEGLFFLLLIASLYFLEKKNYWPAALCAALSSLTRLIGVFIFIPFLFHFLAENKNVSQIMLKVNKMKLFLLSPFLGLISYMGYLWITTGDPLFFFNSQPIYGANRSTHFILLPQVYYRYIRILITASHDFRWYMSLAEIAIFSLVLVVLILDSMSLVANLRGLQKANRTNFILLGVNIFSLINLVLPTVTGTFSSIPRYALFSLSFFLYLGRVKSQGLRAGIIIILITLQIMLFSLFIQGYFIG